jgi:MarR family transcriptional regulator, organic hydroperoxide resistance regulator
MREPPPTQIGPTMPLSSHDHLIDLLVHARVRIEREIGLILHEDEHRITFGHWCILKQLDPNEGKAMGELHRATSIDDSSLTKLVDNLIARGLAFRLADTKDRRKVLICSTEKGDALLKRLGKRIRKRQREFLPDVDEAAIGQLSRYLAAIAS